MSTVRAVKSIAWCIFVHQFPGNVLTYPKSRQERQPIHAFTLSINC